jgi:pantoate--beta-alanine ligase
MAKSMKLPIEVVGCETARESNGLAMSSRNLRLNSQEKKEASIIAETLIKGRELAKFNDPISTKKEMEKYFQDSKLDLEYIEIIHPSSLQTLNKEWVPQARACIAAFCGNVRLIDNMAIKD